MEINRHGTMERNVNKPMREPLWSRLEGSGPDVIVLLHGLTGDAASVARYQPVVPGIASLFIEMPGHGRSPGVGDFSRDDVIARVADTIQRQVSGDGLVHVLGVSLGAVVARGLALLPGFPIDSIILIRPAHTTAPVPDHLAMNLVVAELLEDDPVSAMDRLRENAGFAEVQAVSPYAAANLLAKTRVTDPVLARHQAHLLRAGSAWTTPPGQILLPALVIAAAGDALHPTRVAQQWTQELPNARLAEVPAPGEASHGPIVRQLVEEHLRSFDA